MNEVEKKGFGRAKAGLVVSAVLIVILSVSNVWFYTNLQNQINTLNNDKNNLQIQVNTLQSQIDSLNTTYHDYVLTHSHSNVEYDTLKSDYDTMWEPYLIKVDLRADDVRPWFATPYLHVYGYLCNVNRNWAYNSDLHVVAYQNGGVKVIDTYISLGTISGESWTSVDAKIYYSGSALVSWTITPEWTSTP